MHWFDINNEWLEENIMTCETSLNKIILQTNIRGHDTKIDKLFVVPIGNAKILENIVFHPSSAVLDFLQKTSNSFFCSLSSPFHIIDGNRSITSLVHCIKESYTLQTDEFRNIIHSDNDIMKNRMHINGEQHIT